MNTRIPEAGEIWYRAGTGAMVYVKRIEKDIIHYKLIQLPRGSQLDSASEVRYLAARFTFFLKHYRYEF